MTAAVIVMLAIVITFLVFAALIYRAEEDQADDNEVWRRLIHRYDEENHT